MTPKEKPDPDEHFEKVKEGIGPEEKTSYASAGTADNAKKRAEEVEHKVHEDRRAEGSDAKDDA